MISPQAKKSNINICSNGREKSDSVQEHSTKMKVHQSNINLKERYRHHGGVQTVDMPDQEIMSLIIREWGLNPVTSSTVNVHSTLPFKHHELYELMKGIDWD